MSQQHDKNIQQSLTRHVHPFRVQNEENSAKYNKQQRKGISRIAITQHVQYNDENQDQSNRAQTHVDAMQGQINYLLDRITQLQKEIKNNDEVNAKTYQQREQQIIQKYQQQIEIMQKQIKQNNKCHHNTKNQKMEIQDKKYEQNERCQQWQKQNKKLQEQNNMLKYHLGQSETQMKDLQAKYRQTYQQLYEMQAKFNKLQVQKQFQQNNFKITVKEYEKCQDKWIITQQQQKDRESKALHQQIRNKRQQIIIMQKQHSIMSEDIKILQAQLKTMSDDKQTKLQFINNLQKKLNDSIENNEHLHRIKLELEKEKYYFQRRYSFMEDQLKVSNAYKNQQENSVIQINHLRDQNNKYQILVAQLQQKNVKLTNKIHQMSVIIESGHNEMQHQRQELEIINQQWQVAKNKITYENDENYKDRVELQHHISQLKRQISMQNHEIHEYQKTSKQLRLMIHTLEIVEKQYDLAKQQIEEYKQMIHEYTNEKQQIQNKCEKLLIRLEDIHKEQIKRGKQYQKLQQQHQKLQQQYRIQQNEHKLIKKEHTGHIRNQKEEYETKNEQIKMYYQEIVMGLKQEIVSLSVERQEKQLKKGGNNSQNKISHNQSVYKINEDKGLILELQQQLSVFRVKLHKTECSLKQQIIKQKCYQEQKKEYKRQIDVQIGKRMQTIWQYDGMKTEIMSLRSQQQQSRQKIQVLEQQINVSNQEIARVNHQLIIRANKIKDNQSQIKEQYEIMHQNSGVIKELQAKVKQLQMSVVNFQLNLSQCNICLQKYQESIVRYQEDVQLLENDYEHHLSIIKNYKYQIEQLQGAIDKSRSQIQEQEKQIGQLLQLRQYQECTTRQNHKNIHNMINEITTILLLKQQDNMVYNCQQIMHTIRQLLLSNQLYKQQKIQHKQLQNRLNQYHNTIIMMEQHYILQKQGIKQDYDKVYSKYLKYKTMCQKMQGELQCRNARNQFK